MTTVIITSNLENEIRDIRALEAKIAELDEMRKEKEALIKSVLDEAGLEEMKIGAFTVRFTNIVRNNFNTTAFKKKYLELYNAFIKQSNYRKFSIVQGLSLHYKNGRISLTDTYNKKVCLLQLKSIQEKYESEVFIKT